MKHPLHLLREYWGHEQFRPLQEDIIQSVLNGRDTVALLPTGGGKSVCFQVPALATEGICVVVSPLVALMNDQVNGLREKGIKALCLAGGISQDALTALLDNARFGNYKFLYLSPERLQQEQVQNALRKMNVNVIAVDEAHCISQWGNDFRPAYQHIKVLREMHPLIPIIALTATATPEVLTDTLAQLQLERPQVFKSSFARNNLSYKVYPESDKRYRVSQLLKDHPGTAIVYVRNRKQTEVFSRQLQNQGFSSTFYHGGLPPKEKQQRLEAWKTTPNHVMVATNAFGMGIDFAHVRHVIHIQLPESLESYFQEAGRAGRDGKAAQAVVLYDESDKTLLKRQFVDTLPSVGDLKKLYRILNNYFQISYGEGAFTEHDFSLVTFCQTYGLNPMVTFNGLNTLDRIGVLQLSKQFGRKSKLQFLVSSQQLLKRFEDKVAFSVVGKTILRIYGGIFDAPNAVNLELVASKSGISVDRIITTLKEMEHEDLLTLSLFETDAKITFLVPREDDRTINPFSKDITQLNEKKKQQVHAVLQYVENTTQCLQGQLLAYFGEESAQPCENCSVCLEKTQGSIKVKTLKVTDAILALLKEGPMDSRTVSENLTFAETEVLQGLQWLLDRKKIKLNAVNQYYRTS